MSLKCDVCGDPAMTQVLKDPFGKSDQTGKFCAVHAPKFSILHREVDQQPTVASSNPIVIPPGNDAFSFVCTWLKSALDCKNFIWSPDQHDAATSDLREAVALLAEVEKHAVHMASGGLPDDEKRYTRADLMHMLAVIRALEDHKKLSGEVPQPDETRTDDPRRWPAGTEVEVFYEGAQTEWEPGVLVDNPEVRVRFDDGDGMPMEVVFEHSRVRRKGTSQSNGKGEV